MTELITDAIGNQVAPESESNPRESKEGFLYKENGYLFMFISGAFTEAEIALSVHTWDCEGFISSKGTEVSGYNSNEYRLDMNASPPVLIRRDPMPVKLVGNILSGVPAGGTATIEGFPYPTDGTDIELYFGKPGTYTVKCEAFPYLTAEVEVVYAN